MKVTLFHCLCLFLFLFGILSIDPPLWPERFTQSMTVSFSDMTTTAKFWYDSTLKSQRFDLQNGNSKGGCGAIHPGDTPCSYLINDGWLYFVYTEKQICCKLVQEPIKPRNWLQNYTYIGQAKIDEEMFDVWNEKLEGNFDSYYYAEKSQKRIPRRECEGGNVFLDYWMNSYSEKPINPSVFQIPSYCEKMCWSTEENTAQFDELVQNVRKLTSSLTFNEFISVKEQ